MQPEHPFAPFIRTLGKGKRGSRALTRDESRQAMKMILKQEVTPEQLGAFLMLLRVKEETAEEVTGFVEAIKEYTTLPSNPPKVDLDWSSYAGKRRQLPWFLLSTLALAETGIKQRHLRDDELDVTRLTKIWQGSIEDEYATGAITGTLAITLKLMGKADTMADAEQLATDLWNNRSKNKFGAAA